MKTRWQVIKFATSQSCDGGGHVAAFNARSRTCRKEVVRLLMWLIGKSQVGAEKEFDRTVAYSDNTIAALKEFSQVSSLNASVAAGVALFEVVRQGLASKSQER